jgi:hypothetical protein
MKLAQIIFNKVPARGDLFGYAAECVRPLSGNEMKVLVTFCLDTFGPGGVLPSTDNSWTYSMMTQIFSFKSPVDQMVFILGAGE